MLRPTTDRRDCSRRSVLGLGLVGALGSIGAVAAAGCSPDDGATGPRPAPSTSPGTGTTSGAGVGGEDAGDPDAALVEQLRIDLSGAHARVRANRREHPSLARRLRGLEQLHARHAAELGGLLAVRPASVRAERRPSLVVPRLARDEGALERRLVDDAVEADSGALALLLASMAAGVAQERARL